MWLLIFVFFFVLKTGGVQHCSVCSDGASGTRDGAGTEEATHARDQTTKL